jgi:hypothetical protein
MSKRKQPETFDVAGLKQVEQRLFNYRDELVKRIRAAVAKDVPSFDDAARIRDMGQLLTTTCLVIENMPMVIQLAELSGKAQMVPKLNDCGLDKLDDGE